MCVFNETYHILIGDKCRTTTIEAMGQTEDVTLHIWGWFFCHDDVIKWKHFLRYWLFVRRIHRSPMNSHHKGAKLWCFLDLRLNKRLSKHLRRRWFQTPSRPSWRHCNERIENNVPYRLPSWVMGCLCWFCGWPMFYHFLFAPIYNGSAVIILYKLFSKIQAVDQAQKYYWAFSYHKIW